MKSFIGLMPLNTFIAALIFAMLGWVLHKLITGTKRDTKSTRSPKKWSWKFWIKDNIHEAFLHFCLLYSAVRFAPDLIKVVAPQWVEFFHDADNMLIYLVVGWLASYPINKLKKATKVIKP